MRRLRDELDGLPADLRRQVLTHASWVERRAESYERLAFLGDSVLELAISSHLFPRLAEDRFGPGRLTKIRAQAVSGRACRRVAERLGVPDRMRELAPDGVGQNVETLVEAERVLASVTEAIIGAVFLHRGYEPTAEAVVEAFAPELEDALENPVDFKSALQERLARRGELVAYTVADESGPPHDRTFEVVAEVAGEELGRGSGRSKKDAEQEAARSALAELAATEP